MTISSPPRQPTQEVKRTWALLLPRTSKSKMYSFVKIRQGTHHQNSAYERIVAIDSNESLCSSCWTRSDNLHARASYPQELISVPNHLLGKEDGVYYCKLLNYQSRSKTNVQCCCCCCSLSQAWCHLHFQLLTKTVFWKSKRSEEIFQTR